MPDFPRMGTGYELTANKGVASGYVGLGANILVPTTQLGSGTPVGNYLKGDQTWSSPPAGTPNIKQVEIDFGELPKEDAEFVINDTDVSLTSQITGGLAYEAPTGKELDEIGADAMLITFAPMTSQLKIYIRGLEGYLHDKFKINYLIG